jgi:hypothetical protein
MGSHVGRPGALGIATEAPGALSVKISGLLNFKSRSALYNTASANARISMSGAAHLARLVGGFTSHLS